MVEVVTLDSDDDDPVTTSVQDLYLNLISSLRNISNNDINNEQSESLNRVVATLDDIKNQCPQSYLQSSSFRSHIEECQTNLQSSNLLSKMKLFAIHMSTAKQHQNNKPSPSTKRNVSPGNTAPQPAAIMIPPVSSAPLDMSTTLLVNTSRSGREVSPIEQPSSKRRKLSPPNHNEKENTITSLHSGIIPHLNFIKTKYPYDTDISRVVQVIIESAEKDCGNPDSYWLNPQVATCLQLFRDLETSFSLLHHLYGFLKLGYFRAHPPYIRPSAWFADESKVSRFTLCNYTMFLIFKRSCLKVIPYKHKSFVDAFSRKFKEAFFAEKKKALHRISQVELIDDETKIKSKSYGATLLKCLNDCVEMFIKAKKLPSSAPAVIELDDEEGNNTHVPTDSSIAVPENPSPKAQEENPKTNEKELLQPVTSPISDISDGPCSSDQQTYDQPAPEIQVDEENTETPIVRVASPSNLAAATLPVASSADLTQLPSESRKDNSSKDDDISQSHDKSSSSEATPNPETNDAINEINLDDSEGDKNESSNSSPETHSTSSSQDDNNLVATTVLVDSVGQYKPTLAEEHKVEKNKSEERTAKKSESNIGVISEKDAHSAKKEETIVDSDANDSAAPKDITECSVTLVESDKNNVANAVVEENQTVNESDQTNVKSNDVTEDETAIKSGPNTAQSKTDTAMDCYKTPAGDDKAVDNIQEVTKPLTIEAEEFDNISTSDQSKEASVVKVFDVTPEMTPDRGMTPDKSYTDPVSDKSPLSDKRTISDKDDDDSTPDPDSEEIESFQTPESEISSEISTKDSENTKAIVDVPEDINEKNTSEVIQEISDNAQEEEEAVIDKISDETMPVECSNDTSNFRLFSQESVEFIDEKSNECQITNVKPSTVQYVEVNLKATPTKTTSGITIQQEPLSFNANIDPKQVSHASDNEQNRSDNVSNEQKRMSLVQLKSSSEPKRLKLLSLNSKQREEPSNKETSLFETQEVSDDDDDDMLMIVKPCLDHVEEAGPSNDPEKEEETKEEEESEEDPDLDESSAEYQQKVAEIAKLSKKLVKLARRIKAVKEADIGLDEMEKWGNLYCQEDSLKKKHGKILKKLESLQGEMNLKYNFHVKVSCGIPKIDSFIEDRINSRQKFPDIEDVRRLMDKALKTNKLSMKESKIETLVRQIFLDVGTQIQTHRKTELRLDGGFHLMDRIKITEDPAKKDPELRKKLSRAKKEAKVKLEKIQSTFDIKQFQEELMEDDIVDDEMSENEKEELKKQKKEKEQNKESEDEEKSNSEEDKSEETDVNQSEENNSDDDIMITN